MVQFMLLNTVQVHVMCTQTAPFKSLSHFGWEVVGLLSLGYMR